ncbi:MAG: aspartyl/asparaginyl beta-hydroxylase domain-containing protein [Jatrophihabitantaceae bacterium]
MTATELDERQLVRAALLDWAGAEDVPGRELERLLAGIEGSGDGRGPLQDCFYFFPGLRSQPWHDPVEYPWVAALEGSFAEIRQEFLTQYQGGLNRHPEAEQLAASGAWSTYHFYRMAQPFPDHLSSCPATAAALAQVPGIEGAGMAYFSAMAPGTTVKPHCGFVNARIRCHLGLVVPPGCWMRVGGERRSWSEGSCLVFDDSFEHEVQISDDGYRAVLLLDAWHPDLTPTEIRGLTHLMRTWRELFS